MGGGSVRSEFIGYEAREDTSKGRGTIDDGEEVECGAGGDSDCNCELLGVE